MSEIEATGSVLFGVSVDDVESHKRFRAEQEFGFSLLADTEFEVSKQYSGIIESVSMLQNGQPSLSIKQDTSARSTPEINVKTHGEDVVALLKEVLPKIEVGQPAPDFIATDSTGKSYQLSELIEKKNVVLSFYPRDFGRG